ncbi:MAG TPA: serine hydrolase domain-containing protein [Acidimicrobiales bacterium]|nr:serine hydrolase domain-containing protein [Acidimicrobiales bacterium]
MTSDQLPEGIEGECHPRFAAIAWILAEQLTARQHHGAAIAVHHRGVPVVDIWGGSRGAAGTETPWTSDTLVLSFSTTKGVAATALHMAMERAGLSYDTPVHEVWPDFLDGGTGGPFKKDGITIRHVLCHEAGIPNIRDVVDDVAEIGDWDHMIGVLNGMEPLWEPGTANGYHAVTFGWLVGELVHRLDGRSFTAFLAEEIVAPLELDGMFVGVPSDEQHRVAPLQTEMIKEGPDIAALLGEDHLLFRSLSPPGDVEAWLNTPQGMGSCVPSFTGCFTARSLSRLYACLERGGTLDGVRLLSPETIATATTVQNTRPDLVLFVPINWKLGFISGGASLSPAGPNPEAFGHSGLGGSLAFADPKAEVSVAVTLDLLARDILSDDRAMRIAHAAVAASSS